jgi:hypothetical protein
MSKSQRDKGASYEREVMAQFSAHAGTTYRRILGQARDSGADGKVGQFRIECKRRARLATQAAWYAQVQQATQDGEVPIVVMREDNGASMVLLSLADFLTLI